MKTIVTALISFILVIITAIGVYNFMPIEWVKYLDFKKTPFGSTLTTITSATLISDLATVLPNNFNALNSGKMETSTTSVKGITTLAGLTTVGTITTGTWTADAIGVGYGGTGTTSPTSKQIMFGNGASGLQVIGSAHQDNFSLREGMQRFRAGRLQV